MNIILRKVEENFKAWRIYFQKFLNLASLKFFDKELGSLVWKLSLHMHMQELHCTPYKLFHFVNEKFVYNQKKKKKKII